MTKWYALIGQAWTFIKTYRRELLITLALLSAIELTRRGFSTVTCFVELRYHPLAYDRSGLWDECVGRHMLFPLRLFR